MHFQPLVFDNYIQNSYQDKVGNAGRRLEKFGTVMSQVWQMQNDFERR